MSTLPDVGTVFERRHQFTQADFDLFARLSGDDNPIHVDPAFAAQMRFGKPVAHGMLLYGIICGLLSRHFPGAVQLEQHMIYPAPTFAGEEIRVRAELISAVPELGQATLSTVITGEDGRVTCEGQTLLEFPLERQPGELRLDR